MIASSYTVPLMCLSCARGARITTSKYIEIAHPARIGTNLMGLLLGLCRGVLEAASPGLVSPRVVRFLRM